MAQDLRSLFKQKHDAEDIRMSEGHEARFLKRLEEELPEEQKPGRFNFFTIAASVVVLLGLSYGVFQMNTSGNNDQENTNTIVSNTTKTLGDYSPDLKKVEDYYLASINLQLSKLELTPANKDLVDGYMERLKELNDEYDNLTRELNINGPNEKTLNALIDNLKFRLNLVTRLKDKINEFNEVPFSEDTL